MRCRQSLELKKDILRGVGGVPRRHEAAARLSRHITAFCVADVGRFRAAFRPSSAHLASALKTSAGPRWPAPLKIGELS
jgi:hypothetical protein